MIGPSPEFVVRLTRAWALLYTRGLRPDLRAERRNELESDLWEHRGWGTSVGRDPGRIALEILWRLAAGIPADLSWRRLEGRSARHQSSRSAGGETMNNNVNHGMVALTGVVGIACVSLGIAVTAFDDGGERAQGGLFVVAGILILGGLVAMRRGGRGARGVVAIGTGVPAALAVWTIVMPLIAIAIFAWLIVSDRAGGSHSAGTMDRTPATG